MAKILITGGTGYIGSHTVVEFLNAGYEITIIDSLANSSVEVLDRIKVITGCKPDFYKVDLANQSQTERFFVSHNDFDLVVHFAAFKSVKESVLNPLKYYQNNIFATVNLLRAMAQYKIKNLIFSSSCTVYGQPDKLPVKETSPIKKAESPYGHTKQISEEIIENTLKAYDFMQAISLRYFNPIGAHPSALIGEQPTGTPENLIPYLTQTVAGLREVLYVFGNDYNTPDGTPIRDYIYIMDLANAHLAAAERLLKAQNTKRYEVFNIGVGRGYSVLEIIKLFEKATGEKVPYKITGRRPGDIEKIWADTSLAEKQLGWKAKYSIEYALKTAWEWQKKLLEKNEK